jgi:hypothetical protein
MKLLRVLIPLAVLFFAAHAKAGATCPPVPNIFVNGTPADANAVNANFTAVQNCANNIDNSSIGANGLYASQIIPLTVGEATFGGSLGYTFPYTVTAGPTYGNNPLGGLPFQWTGSTGTVAIGASSGIIVGTTTASLATIGVAGSSPVNAFDVAGDASFAGSLQAANVTDNALTASRCVQTGTAGILQSSSGVCYTAPPGYTVTLTTSGTCAIGTNCTLVSAQPTGTPSSSYACTTRISTNGINTTTTPVININFNSNLSSEGDYFIVSNTTGATISSGTTFSVSGVCF